MSKNLIKLTENDIKALVNEAVKNVLNEHQMGSGEALISKIVNQLKDFMDSNHIVFTTPNPSSTELAVQQYVTQARDLLARAQFALKSLRY